MCTKIGTRVMVSLVVMSKTAAPLRGVSLKKRGNKCERRVGGCAPKQNPPLCFTRWRISRMHLSADNAHLQSRATNTVCCRTICRVIFPSSRRFAACGRRAFCILHGRVCICLERSRVSVGGCRVRNRGSKGGNHALDFRQPVLPKVLVLGAMGYLLHS